MGARGDEAVERAREVLAEEDAQEPWADRAARREGDERPGWLRSLSGLPGLGLALLPLDRLGRQVRAPSSTRRSAWQARGVTANEEMGRYWNEEGGLSWVQEADTFDAQLAPFLPVLLELASPLPGERVVDVGCGAGALTVQVAQAVAPEGEVLGLDVSAPLAGLAATRAESAGAPATFVVADAQTADLSEHGPFDLLISRFGVMFFDDPVAAFSNLRSALRPGGRLAFACWQGFTHNPWMQVPMSAALQHLPPPPLLEPGAPGPWAFEDADRVRRLLSDAGFADVCIDPHEGQVPLAGGGAAEQVYEFLKQTSLGRALLTQDDPSVAEEVEASVLAALREHETVDGVLLPYAAWLVSARVDG